MKFLVMSTLPRGLSLGFGLGFVVVTLWFRQTSPVAQQHIVRKEASNGQGMHPPCASADVEEHAAAAILAARQHEVPPPPTVAPPPPSTHATIAACVGGLLSLDIVMRGRSVRLGVLEPLQPDVFVAGTLNATHAEMRRGGPEWRRRLSYAIERIAELAPFTDVQIAPQPSAAELTDALRSSGHFGAYEKQASGPGTGRLRAEDMDPRLWLPTMLSPAVGNPQANTLREFHYQSRCMGMIEQAEARRRRPYSRVLFTRLENHWLYPHPPLALLSSDRVWVPAGEDNGGVNDRHWLASRKAVPTLAIESLRCPLCLITYHLSWPMLSSWQAGVLMRRWDALLDGSALRAVHGGTALGQVRPRFVSSEIFLQLLARRALHACMVGPERVVAPASSLT